MLSPFSSMIALTILIMVIVGPATQHMSITLMKMQEISGNNYILTKNLTEQLKFIVFGMI